MNGMMNGGIDPQMLAMALRGGAMNGGRTYNPGGGARLTPQIGAGGYVTPETAQRMALAEGLSGRRRPPIHSTAQFGAELGQDALAAAMVYKAKSQAEEDGKARAGLLADALRAGAGRPAETRDGYADPDTGEGFKISWNAVAPNRAKTIDMLTSSPLTTDLGVGMMQADDEARRKREALLLEKGFEADPATGGLRPIKGGYADPGYVYATKEAESGAGAAADAWKKAQEPHVVPEGGKLVVPDSGAYGPGTAPPGSPQRSGLMGERPPPGGWSGGTKTVVRPTKPGRADVEAEINRYAAEYGLDPTVALTAAQIESNLGQTDDNAGSRYKGVYQLGADRYKKYSADPSNFTDQVKAGIQSLRDTKAELTQALGREPEPHEVYLAHQQGVTGAKTLLTADRNARASDVIAPYYKDGLHVKAITANLLPGAGNGADTTVGQFVDSWRDRYTRGSKRYGAEAPQDAASLRVRVAAAEAETATDAAPAAAGGYQVVLDNPKERTPKPQSDIGKLYADRDAMPEGDPRRAAFDEAIKKHAGQELSPGDRQAVMETEDKASSAASAMASLRKARELNDRAYSGPIGSRVAPLVAGLPGKHPDAEATIEYQNLIAGQALEQMKAVFGANPTEGERTAMIELQASVDKPQAVRARMIDAAMKKLEVRHGEMTARAKALREQTYFDPGAATRQVASPAAPPVDDPLGIR